MCIRDSTYTDSGFYNICLSITDSDGCSGTFCYNDFHILRTTNYMIYVNVIPPVITGVNEPNLPDEGITIYPNPAKDELIVNSSNLPANKIITIYDVLGKIIYTVKTNSKQETINCKPFPSGIYILQMKTENGAVVKKFVKE